MAKRKEQDSADPPQAGGRAEGRKRRPQMADLARLAGVSTSTVSRALSGSGLVNQETQERIMALARALDYSVNVGARSLRLGHNRTVAVVVPRDANNPQGISDPFFLNMLGALADALTDRGYDMLVSRVDAEYLDRAAQYCDTGRAAGVILIGQWHHHDQLNQMAARGVAIVVWGAQMPQQLYVSVGCDNALGGYLATRHLLEVGRRRIAFLGDPSLPEVAPRLDGYRRALDEAGVAGDDALVVPVPFLAGAAREAVDGLIDGGSFDAVFGSSDLLAMSAMSRLSERGLRVPEDVAVVGFDDVPLAALCSPPLTTVRQPIEDGARAMVEALLKIIGGERAESCVLPTALVVRATTGSAQS